MAVKSPEVRKVVKGYLTKLSCDAVILEPSQMVTLSLGKSEQSKGALKSYLDKKFKKYLDSVGSKQGVLIESSGFKGCWYIELPYNDSFYYFFETEDFIQSQLKKGVNGGVYATPFAS